VPLINQASFFSLVFYRPFPPLFYLCFFDSHGFKFLAYPNLLGTERLDYCCCCWGTSFSCWTLQPTDSHNICLMNKSELRKQCSSITNSAVNLWHHKNCITVWFLLAWLCQLETYLMACWEEKWKASCIPKQCRSTYQVHTDAVMYRMNSVLYLILSMIII
jgi:hypothetical protein